MEIKEIQKKSVEAVKNRLKKKGIVLDNELILIHLMEESGEIAQQIMNKKLDRKEMDIDNLGEEIADCMILLMTLASQFNLDIEKELLDKITDVNNKPR